MRCLFPIHVLTENTVSTAFRNVVPLTIRKILQIAGVEDQIPVHDHGMWRAEDFRDADGRLCPYRSVDWYIERGLTGGTDPRRLNTTPIQLAFGESIHRYHGTDTHTILVTDRDLSFGGAGFVLGSGGPSGVILTTHRLLRDDWCRDPIECFRTLAFHEVGHMLGLPNVHNGRTDLEDSLGMHCKSLNCVMRQRLDPRGWNGITRDRLKAPSPYCDPCQQDLKGRFLPYVERALPPPVNRVRARFY